jgi:hypothetical protein
MTPAPFPPSLPGAAQQALAGLAAWLATVRVPGGYGGPAVSVRAASLSYCGPAADWRLEGILDGWSALADGGEAEVTATALQQLASDLATLAPAMLRDGSLRNSFFEFNPCEGGMPHEPAVMAAALRARRRLRRHGAAVPAGVEEAVARHVEERLLKHMWNKRLQTFNDWPQGQYEYYSSAGVAAAIELLLEYGDLSGCWPRLDHYLEGAAASLLAVQRTQGVAAGGMLLSNRPGAGCSPFLTARCLPALTALYRRTGDPALKTAAVAAAAFVRGQALPGGGFTWLVHEDRPAIRFPIMAGAVAGTLVALERAGMLDAHDQVAHLPWLLARRQPTGAFATAVGFSGTAGAVPPDWRDLLPVTGWLDKIFALLALGAGRAGAKNAPLHPAGEAAAPAPFSCAVCLGWGRAGRYLEEAGELRIEDGRGRSLFRWRKGDDWAGQNDL